MNTLNMTTGADFNCKNRLVQLDETFRFLEKDFGKTRMKLYKYLGEVYGLIQDVGSDAARVTSLDDALCNFNIPKKTLSRAKTVTRKVALFVFARESTDLINKSTRSLYTRALELAVERNLGVDAFVDELNASGVYAFANQNATKDEESKISDAEAIESRRSKLQNQVLANAPNLCLIDGKNPSNGFALVLYRVDSGVLVPCSSLDESKAIDGYISCLLNVEKIDRVKKADEAAARVRASILSQEAA